MFSLKRDPESETMGFMANLSIPSKIAMALLNGAIIISIISMATTHWQEGEVTIPNSK